ncbi:MAG: DUF748 domain-containing protein [Deltaproteobacteria bacterium]
MKARYKLLIALLVTAALLTAAALVLSARLPAIARDIAVKTAAEKTGKQLSIGTVKVDLFKGIVFTDLALSSQGRTVASAKRASAHFNILSLFSGNLIVDAFELESPSVPVVRRKDGSFEIAGVSSLPRTKAPAKKEGFGLVITRVAVKDAMVDFTDDSLSPAFRSYLYPLEFYAQLSPPSSAAFRFSAGIARGPARIVGKGTYELASRALSATAIFEHLAPADFQPYLSGKFSITGGALDGAAAVEYKERVLSIKTDSTARNCGVELTAGKASFDGKISASYTGHARPTPPEYTVSMTLSRLEAALANGIKINAAGALQIDPDVFLWKGIKLIYAGEEYVSSGSVRGFSSPTFEFGIYSTKAQLEGLIQTKNRILQITRIKGVMNGSNLFVTGTVDVSDLTAVPADLSVTGDVDLTDLNVFFSKQQGWQQASPSGRLHTEMKVSGDLRQPCRLKVKGAVKSKTLCAYGLAFGNLHAEYDQENGAGHSLFNFSFYDGIVHGEASLDLTKTGYPYTVKTTSEGINVQKLKNDTPFRAKDLSGTINVCSVISGQAGAIGNPEVRGNVQLADGKIFQLDILQGLGQMLFPELLSVTFSRGAADFNVKDRMLTVTEASLASSTLQLTGKGTADLSSPEQPVNGLFNIQVSSSIIPRLGKFKNIASVILDQSRRVVGVQVSGTRTHPQYRLTQPLVDDLFRGLRDLLGPPQKK